jgi:hypothetical protein
MREDLEQRETALAMGFQSTGDWTKGESLTFMKGAKRIWQIRNGWQCADLIQEGDDSYYRNHRLYPTLEEALTKENK